MFRDILWVGAGSFIGGTARYLVTLLMRCTGGFPWGTFSINMAGCLLIGVLWGWVSRTPGVSPALNLFFMVGFCGGFTTFSTFSKESLTLLQAGSYGAFALYAAGSVAIGILAVALGFMATK